MGRGSPSRTRVRIPFRVPYRRVIKVGIAPFGQPPGHATLFGDKINQVLSLRLRQVANVSAVVGIFPDAFCDFAQSCREYSLVKHPSKTKA